MPVEIIFSLKKDHQLLHGTIICDIVRNPLIFAIYRLFLNHNFESGLLS